MGPTGSLKRKDPDVRFATTARRDRHLTWQLEQGFPSCPGMGFPVPTDLGEHDIEININRVRAGTLYRFRPVPLDRWMPPFGVLRGTLEPGSTVRVVDLPGCLPASTMGHAYIEDPETGEYLGLVHCNSLRSVREGDRRS